MLELSLFGPFRLASDGTPLPRLRSHTGPWLLTLLALRHGRPVERPHLAGLLWPDSTEEQALYNLRRNLSDLRAVLGPHAARLQTPTRATVCLDLTGARCDALLFDAAVRRGDQTALEEAVTLYRGPLLEGCYEEWLLPERQTREADYLRALETLAAEAPPTEAVRYLRLLLAVDPAQEAAQRRLMRALAALGDHAGAARLQRLPAVPAEGTPGRTGRRNRRPRQAPAGRGPPRPHARRCPPDRPPARTGDSADRSGCGTPRGDACPGGLAPGDAHRFGRRRQDPSGAGGGPRLPG